MSKPRKSPAQQRSRATVEFIVEAAAHIFDREGIEATTNRIAEHAGVSIGSLYQYFPDKLALIHELAMRHLDDVEGAFAEVLDRAPPDLDAFVASLVDAAAGLHAEQGRLHHLMREFAPRTPELVERFVALTEDITGQIEKRLADLGVDDPAGRARLAFATVDAQVHGVLAGTTAPELRDRRLALVVEQVTALLSDR